MQTCTTADVPYPPEVVAVLDVARDIIEDGHLHSILSSAVELRDLRLHFPFDQNIMTQTSLVSVFRDTTWKKLRKLQLSQVFANSANVVDFLLRHKATLRELSLYEMELLEGTWESTFMEIAGKLPRLRRIRLRGSFVDESAEWEFGSIPRKFSARGNAIENYILRGGSWPDLEAFPDREQEKKDFPGYVEPTLAHEDEDTWSDDSAESYDSDDFGKL
ncbi:hypothetical protein LTR08_004804 [Meristemomyces frigidus]|nr:hypothetical protein LTR08_004804 [Meristemomyces frigidus]